MNKYVVRWVSGMVAACLGSGLPAVVFAEAIDLSVGIGGTTQVSGLPQYINAMYRYSLGAAAILATIMIVYGGFLYLAGSAADNINKGKEVIKDAIAGLLLVFLAVVILRTVNPETTKLTMPSIKTVAKEELKLTSASSTETTLNMEAGRNCVTDADCGGTAKCLRTGVVTGSDGKIDITEDSKVTTNGFCASGRENDRCRCEGTGCNIVNDKPNFMRPTGATTADTNNGGTGVFPCANTPANNRCAISQISEGGRRANWKCAVIASAGSTDARPRSQTPVVNCTTDAQCDASTEGARRVRSLGMLAAGSCIRHDASQGTCAWGLVGDRCRCRSTAGCNPTPAAPYVARECTSGTTCKLYNDGNPASGTEADWFCALLGAGERPSTRPEDCLADEDCPTGESCIRYNNVISSSGRCSKGLEGQLCYSSGNGRNVSPPAGKHTNRNNAQWVPCAEGLRCVFQTTRDVGTVWSINGVQNDVWTCQRLRPRPIDELTPFRTPTPIIREQGSDERCSVDSETGVGAPNASPSDPRVTSYCQTSGNLPLTSDCLDVCALRRDISYGTCVRFNGASDPHAGDCSRGLRGHRCRCVGTGCGVHNDTNVASCVDPLRCTIFYGRGASQSQEPGSFTRDEWFCTDPIEGASVGNPAAS